jgi:hypothetical protein
MTAGVPTKLDYLVSVVKHNAHLYGSHGCPVDWQFAKRQVAEVIGSQFRGVCQEPGWCCTDRVTRILRKEGEGRRQDFRIISVASERKGHGLQGPIAHHLALALPFASCLASRLLPTGRSPKVLSPKLLMISAVGSSRFFAPVHMDTLHALAAFIRCG